MRIELEDVRVQGRRGPLLELDDLSLESGECVLLAGEPGQGHTALALVLTGRLAPFTGRIGLVRDDGSWTESRRELRRATAVVDLPAVSEPDDALRVGTVAAEDLALASRGGGPGATTRWLDSYDLAGLQRERVDALPGPTRTALLTALAVERRGVRFLVLALPDRHGGEPSEWWSVAEAFASQGYGVLVGCGRSSARDLGATIAPAQHASDQRARPLEALRTRPAGPQEEEP